MARAGARARTSCTPCAPTPGRVALEARDDARRVPAIQRASAIELPVEAGDFKLLSRRVVDHLLALDEQDLYLRGLVTWVGFQVAVPVRAPGARRGRHALPAAAQLGAGVDVVAGVTSFSHAPLMRSCCSASWSAALEAHAARAGRAGSSAAPPSAMAWLVAFGVLLWSTLLFGIGVIGLYLARIHRESLGRPRYIVESAIGFDER